MTVTHRMSGTPAHTSWRKMRERCSNPKARQWPWYGGRGIRVCPRWSLFENFLADMGERPPGMTLDRIDTNGDYTPENCRWASQREQVHGQRKTKRVEHEGKIEVVASIAPPLGIAPDVVTARMRRGVAASNLLTTKDLRNPVTEAELRAFDQHRQQGLSINAIAARMKVKPRRVERMAHMRKTGANGWAENRVATYEKKD